MIKNFNINMLLRNSIHFMIISAFVGYLQAQDCVGLKNGEEVRLDTPQMPLENSKIQDQDGLGTCYANTSSIMLQSVLEGNPNISYMQMALNYAENVNRKKEVERFGLNKNGKPFIDTGNICQMIDQTKANGGVCRREDVKFEDIVFSDSVPQVFEKHLAKKKLIESLSRYYENVNLAFKISFNENPEALLKAKNNYTEELKNLLDNNMKMFARKNCEDFDVTNAQNVVSAIAALIETQKANWNGDGELEQKLMPFRADPLSNYSTRTVVGGVETFQFSLRPQVMDLLNKEYGQKLKSTTSAPPNAKIVFAEALAKHTEYGGLNRDKVLDLLNHLDPAVVSKLEEDYQRYVMRDPRVCQKNEINYLADKQGFLTDFNSNTCLANYANLGQNIAELAQELMGISGLDISKLNQFILNSMNLNYDQALSQLLAPDCTDDKKIKIPENLQCHSHNLDFSFEDKLSPNKYSEKLIEEKNNLSRNVLESLQSKKAAAFNVCTIFFKDNAYYSHNSRRTVSGKSESDECTLGPEDKFNGMHTVAVIGQRCKNGKIDYLVQNSWGEWGDLAEKYERDKTPGRAWFNESDIIDNMTSYSTIK